LPRPARAAHAAAIRHLSCGDVARGGGPPAYRRASSQSAFAGVTQDAAVLAFDRRQRATFHRTFEQYARDRVTAGRINKGKQMLARHAALLARVERQFGVPAPVIVAIWGLESDFRHGRHRQAAGDPRGRDHGARLPPHRTVQRELIAALQILQRGDLPLRDLIGAYAGEIGQTQFLPSSYIKYGVDYDGNGHVEPAPQRAGRARLHRQPAQDQRLEGRRALRRGHRQFSK